MFILLSSLRYKCLSILLAGDINDEADIVNCDAGNIKRILMTNEVYNHYLKYGNERNS